MRRLRRRSAAAAAILVVMAAALSGCGMGTIVSDARQESIRNAASALSDAVACFKQVRAPANENLAELARENGLCGNWSTLDATDEELSVFSYDEWNTTWLMRINESASAPVVTVMTEGDARVEVATQEEHHTVIVCWQVTLNRHGGQSEAAEFECPEQWYASLGGAEVMTIAELKEAAAALGVEVTF